MLRRLITYLTVAVFISGLFLNTSQARSVKILAASPPVWVLPYVYRTQVPNPLIDFANNRAWSNGLVVPISTLVSGTLNLNASGLLLNSASLAAIGPLLSAFQARNQTIFAQVSGGSNGANAGIVSFGSTVGAPLFKLAANTLSNFKFNGNTAFLNTANTADWTATNWGAAALNGTGSIANRGISLNGGTSVYVSGDAMGAVTAVNLGSHGGTSLFGGRMATLAVYPIALNALSLSAISQLPPWTLPSYFTDSVGVAGSSGNYISVGINTFQFEYTQPWTIITEVVAGAAPTGPGANIVFTNVDSPGPSYPGYELFEFPDALLHSRLIHALGAGQLIEVKGSTTLTPGQKYILCERWDGSGVAAGVHIYVNGVAETMSTVTDNLGGLSIVSSPQEWLLWNQQQATTFYWTGQGGATNFYNVDKGDAFCRVNTAAVPLPDSTAVGSWALNEGLGLTVNDRSGNSKPGTLTSTVMWP